VTEHWDGTHPEDVMVSEDVDTWPVQVPGATSEHHFRVSVARLVTALDKKGRVLFES
jgi:hypothetical protein